MLNIIAAIALSAAPQASVDYRDMTAVAKFVRDIGGPPLISNVAQMRFIFDKDWLPPVGGEWVVISSTPEGVNMIHRVVGSNDARARFVRVRLERFDPYVNDGLSLLSRMTEYEMRCGQEKKIRVHSITDYPQRTLRGKAVKAQIADRGWVATQDSSLATLGPALCEGAR